MNDRPVKERGRLLIFAKYPRPKSVKTRLVPPLNHDQAATLYTAMLCDSVRAWRQLSEIDLALYVANPDDCKPMELLLRQNGVLTETDIGTDVDLPIIPQRGNDLGERLLNAFAESFRAGYHHVAVIGTDHPTLPDQFISLLFKELDEHDLVLGPADDGGYYAIGLAASQPELFPELFSEMPWSTSDLLRQTIAVADRLGLTHYLLPEWYDVDDERTLRRLMEDVEQGGAGPMVASVLEEMTSLLSEKERGEG